MAHIAVGKRNGRWFVEARGCCNYRSYDRDHAVQVLQGGGRLEAWDRDGFMLTDRKGRRHRYPRSWSSSSSAT